MRSRNITTVYCNDISLGKTIGGVGFDPTTSEGAGGITDGEGYGDLTTS